ncbi:MAG: SPASM domain-containing protein [Lachnospiraceae bacterium]|nr:SPASM domain-containing protein [Lachnospiraceae bacterium]
MIRVKYLAADDGRELAYFPETQRFFFVDDEMKGLIADMDRLSREEVTEKYGIGSRDYEEYLAKMVRQEKPENKEADPARPAENVLPRLVIHLANDCNLRCVYCYAEGGAYHSSQDLMSREMLDRTLDVFFGAYDRISMIQFFGGEPLLNMDLIGYACEKVLGINKERGKETIFGLVTNGTLINDRFIELVRKYRIAVTVSYDGTPEVNDRLRIFPNGAGTSEAVLGKMRKLQEADVPFSIEVTFSEYHRQLGYSVMDIYDRLHKVFPEAGIHIAPAGGLPECGLALQDSAAVFSQGVADAASRAAAEPDKPVLCHATAQSLMEKLGKKDEGADGFFCGAGSSTLSVTTKGDIYPCFMLTDLQEVRFGNVTEGSPLADLYQNENWQRFMRFSYKDDHPECRDCFINTICNACVGQFFLNTGELFRISPSDCERYRRQTEEAIKGLAKIQEARANRM